MNMTRYIVAASIAFGSLSAASAANAAVTINITQSGNDVTLSASGTFDRALSSEIRGADNFRQSINSGYSFLGLGTQQSVDVFGFSGPGAFGSEESFTDVTSSSGTAIGFNTTGPVFFISRNYVSNTAISSSALFSGKTLASLGLSAGTYDYTSGQNKISLVIGQTVAAVPEPATWAMMILGFGVVGAALRRPRRTPAQVA